MGNRKAAWMAYMMIAVPGYGQSIQRDIDSANLPDDSHTPIDSVGDYDDHLPEQHPDDHTS